MPTVRAQSLVLTGQGQEFAAALMDGYVIVADAKSGAVRTRIGLHLVGVRNICMLENGDAAVASHGGIVVVVGDRDRGEAGKQRLLSSQPIQTWAAATAIQVPGEPRWEVTHWGHVEAGPAFIKGVRRDRGPGPTIAVRPVANVVFPDGSRVLYESILPNRVVLLEVEGGPTAACPLCSESLDMGARLPCGHTFHDHCVIQVLLQTPACPTCHRSAIPG